MSALGGKVIAIHDALTAAGVRHAFGGALALAYHVLEPRGTSDIDVNVVSDPARPRVLFEALPSDVTWDQRKLEQVVRDGQTRLWWGEPPYGTPVDLFFPQAQLHDDVDRAAEVKPFEGRELPFLSATHLTVFKAMFARTKDWADIESMLRARTVDVPLVEDYLIELFGADDPRHLGRFREVLAAAALPAHEPPTFNWILGGRDS